MWTRSPLRLDALLSYMEIVGELHRTPGIMGVSHLTCFYAWIRLKAVLLTELLLVCVIWDLLEHKPKFRTSCITLLYLRYESYANSVNDKNSLRKWLFGVGRVFLSRVFIKRVKFVPHAKPLQITDPFNHPIDWGRKRNTWYFMGYTFLLLEAKRTHFPLDEIQ